MDKLKVKDVQPIHLIKLTEFSFNCIINLNLNFLHNRRLYRYEIDTLEFTEGTFSAFRVKGGKQKIEGTETNFKFKLI